MLARQGECQREMEEKPQEEEVQSEPNPTPPQQSLTKQEQFGEVWKERESTRLGRGGGGSVEGCSVEEQMERGLRGWPLSPDLLVDTPLAGAVDRGCSRDSREEVHRGMED